MFPNIQAEPLNRQLKAISSLPITIKREKRPSPTSAPQVTAEGNEVPHRASLSPPHQPCAPHPSQLCCPSPEALQDLNVSHVEGPKMDAALEVQPHQSRSPPCCQLRRPCRTPVHAAASRPAERCPKPPDLFPHRKVHAERILPSRTPSFCRCLGTYRNAQRETSLRQPNRGG